MFILAIVTGVILGLLRRGSLGRLGNLSLRKAPLLLLALVIRLTTERALGWGWDWIIPLGPWLIAVSYLLILHVIRLNRDLPGALPLALGTLANFAVISLNGGLMPVSLKAVMAVGGERLVERLEGETDLVHQLMEPETVLPFLADILYLPPPFPLREVFSVGDVLVCAGLIHMIMTVMTRGQSRGSFGA